MQMLHSALTIALLAAIFLLLAIDEPEPPPFDEESIPYFVDALSDGGLVRSDPAVAAALLQSRTIISTTGVNAQFAKDIISQLIVISARDSDAPIDLHIRTEGGWGSDAFSVVDVMRSIDAPVNVYAMGEVHSAGLILLSAATGTRYVQPNALLGYHSLAPDEEREWADRYQSFFRAYTDLPKEWIEDRSDSMFYMTAEEAIDYGVADELVVSKYPGGAE